MMFVVETKCRDGWRWLVWSHIHPLFFWLLYVMVYLQSISYFRLSLHWHNVMHPVSVPLEYWSIWRYEKNSHSLGTQNTHKTCHGRTYRKENKKTPILGHLIFGLAFQKEGTVLPVQPQVLKESSGNFWRGLKAGISIFEAASEAFCLAPSALSF